MLKTILLLGGSRQQVVAIEVAKKLGYQTVLCDYLSDNPGQYQADKFYQTSTTDREAVLEIARKEAVDGILAYASDPASPTAAYVAEKLGLPTNPLRAVEIMSNKHLFRKHLQKVGLPCPSSVALNGSDESQKWIDEIIKAGLTFPIVIKPTDSSGSKGVSIIDDLKLVPDAVKHAAPFGRNGIMIAEEYIDRMFPNVIGGDIFVVDGRVCFWGLMSCLRDPERNLVPVGKYTLSGLNESQYTNIQKVIQQLVDSLGIRFGELNVEILIGKNDIPYVLELGSRAGGNMIPVQLSDASNIDLIKANVLCAMGEKPKINEYVLKDVFCLTYVLHSKKSGLLAEVAVNDKLLPFIYRKIMYISTGERVESFDGANKAIGILFLRFNNMDQMMSLLPQIHSMIEIKLVG